MSRRLLGGLAWTAASIGWPGLLGVLLLAGAAFVRATLQVPLAEETAGLQDQAARLAARQAERPPAPEEPPLVDRLPGTGRTPEAVARLFAAAAKAGLHLDQGEYRLQVDPTAGLLRYQITLPVEGAWPALRRFLGETLNGNPSLALDGLSLNRPGVEAEELQAVLRLTLYLSGGQAK